MSAFDHTGPMFLVHITKQLKENDIILKPVRIFDAGIEPRDQRRLGCRWSPSALRRQARWHGGNGRGKRPNNGSVRDERDLYSQGSAAVRTPLFFGRIQAIFVPELQFYGFQHVAMGPIGCMDATCNQFRQVTPRMNLVLYLEFP